MTPRGVQPPPNRMQGGGPRLSERAAVGVRGCQSGRGGGGGGAAGPLFVVIPRWSFCWGTRSAPRWGRASVRRPGGCRGPRGGPESQRGLWWEWVSPGSGGLWGSVRCGGGGGGVCEGPRGALEPARGCEL